MWTILLAGIGLWFLVEGLMYAAAPDAMKRLAVWLSNQPDAAVRQMGLLSVAAGVLLLYVLVRFVGV